MSGTDLPCKLLSVSKLEQVSSSFARRRKCNAVSKDLTRGVSTPRRNSVPKQGNEEFRAFLRRSGIAFAAGDKVRAAFARVAGVEGFLIEETFAVIMKILLPAAAFKLASGQIEGYWASLRKQTGDSSLVDLFKFLEWWHAVAPEKPVDEALPVEEPVVRRRLAIQSRWSEWGDMQVFEEGGLARSVAGTRSPTAEPPQYPTKPFLDRLDDAFRVCVCQPTPQVELIAPWVPDAPRSIHLPPATPGGRVGAAGARRAFARPSPASKERLKKLKAISTRSPPDGMDLMTILTAPEFTDSA